MYSLLFYAMFLIFFLTYVKVGIIDFYKKNSIGKYRIPVITFITGAFMVFLGFSLATDIAINTFGLPIRKIFLTFPHQLKSF